MGLNDRDWYKEAIKEKEQSNTNTIAKQELRRLWFDQQIESTKGKLSHLLIKFMLVIVAFFVLLEMAIKAKL